MKKKREDEMQIFCFKSVDLKTIIYQVEKKIEIQIDQECISFTLYLSAY
jgi:hypothetical protein